MAIEISRYTTLINDQENGENYTLQGLTIKTTAVHHCNNSAPTALQCLAFETIPQRRQIRRENRRFSTRVFTFQIHSRTRLRVSGRLVPVSFPVDSPHSGGTGTSGTTSGVLHYIWTPKDFQNFFLYNHDFYSLPPNTCWDCIVHDENVGQSQGYF